MGHLCPWDKNYMAFYRATSKRIGSQLAEGRTIVGGHLIIDEIQLVIVKASTFHVL